MIRRTSLTATDTSVAKALDERGKLARLRRQAAHLQLHGVKTEADSQQRRAEAVVKVLAQTCPFGLGGGDHLGPGTPAAAPRAGTRGRLQR